MLTNGLIVSLLNRYINLDQTRLFMQSTEMKAKCNNWQSCRSFELTNNNCHGCSFQHFQKILDNHKDDEALRFLGDEYFKIISLNRKGTGGRIALDKPMRKLFMKRFPKLEIIPKEKLKVKLYGDNFIAKADGAFIANGTYIFYELKGYGDGTNDVLSAITAAQLLKEVDDFRNSLYYYIGVNSGSRNYPYGLERKSFFDNRLGVTAYVRWAEKNKFLKFYGITDIDALLADIEKNIFYADKVQ